MSFLLGKFTAYESKVPDSAGNYLIKHSVTIFPSGDADHLLLFYDVKAIEILISSEELSFFTEQLVSEQDLKR